MPMNTWIAIPTNGKRETAVLTLASLLHHLDYFQGVYIWENGINHASNNIIFHQIISFLKSLNKTIIIKYSNLPDNSFTKLRNQMLLQAKSDGVEKLLLLDDDVILGKDCLNNLLGTVQLSEKFGWASPLLLYPESNYHSFSNKIYDFWRYILIPKKENEESIVKNKCYMAGTTCLLIDVQNSLAVGGFDFHEELKDFGEDRFFTAKFFNKFDNFVNRDAIAFLTYPILNEGKNWKIPINRLLLSPNISKFLDKEVINYIKQWHQNI